MKTCKTCKHWVKANENDDYRASEICTPLDQDELEPMKTEFEVRICKSPKIIFFERSPESTGVSLIDGSCYYAKMLTGENFGCVNHEAG